MAIGRGEWSATQELRADINMRAAGLGKKDEIELETEPS